MKHVSGMSSALLDDLNKQTSGNLSIKGRGGHDYYKVPQDDDSHSFRVLPGTFGESKENFVVGVLQHWTVKDGKRLPVFCPTMVDNPCPFCESLEDHRGAEKSLKEALKSKELKDNKAQYRKEEDKAKMLSKIIAYLMPRPSWLLNIVDRDTGKVKLFSTPRTVFTKIMDVIANDGIEVVLDPSEGHDFRIKSARKGRGVEYDLKLAAKVTPLADDDASVQEILDKRANLEEIAKFDDYEELASLCSNGIESVIDRGLDDDDDDTYKPSKPKSSSSGKEDNLRMGHGEEESRKESSSSSGGSTKVRSSIMSRMSRVASDD